ncbi:MAG: hypothetical protein ABIP85_27405 [Chthoniobacteraceae bacterium]
MSCKSSSSQSAIVAIFTADVPLSQEIRSPVSAVCGILFRMTPENSPRIRALRMLMMMDAVVLTGLGALFIAVPRRIEAAFHFQNLPVGVDYMIGLWGCVFATVGLGYALAAVNPRRNVLWVQMGIARGVLEIVFGTVCVLRGVVTWEQASFGIFTAAFIAAAYAVLYPRKEGA